MMTEFSFLENYPFKNNVYLFELKGSISCEAIVEGMFLRWYSAPA